jgi:hypothetical protein
MPGGSEICRHFSGIGRGSWQRAYHNANIFWANFLWANIFWAKAGRSIGDMSSSKMPQPPLHPIARHRTPNSTTDHEPNAGSVIQLSLI